MANASVQDQFREKMFSRLDARSIEFDKELASFWAERSAKKTFISSATIELLKALMVKELETRFSIVRDCMLQTLSSEQNAAIVSDLKSIALSRLDLQRKAFSNYFVEEQKKILRQLFSPLLQPEDPLKQKFRQLWNALIQEVNSKISQV